MNSPQPVATAEPPRNLEGWTKMLSEQGMPVFARTARDLGGLSASQDTSASELARVILQDAGMTARMLRVANSYFYNPRNRAISTVSRAVVVLGFDAVRSICFSIAAVETLLQGAQRERVLAEMARSFHAAVQARAFAIKRKDGSPEEVFIAALLFNLGELAFWCASGSGLAERLEAALQKPGVTREQAEEEVLGFKLRQLGAALGREWRLGDLLQNTLEGKQKENPRVSNITLGHELARGLEQGWDAPEVKDLMNHIAETLYLPVDQAERMVRGNARDAAHTAACYGVSQVGRLIPLPRASVDEPAVVLPDPEPIPSPSEFIQPDPQLQLRILRELAGLLETRPNVNLLLEMVLEGIYRGVGMDRTLFALLTSDRQQLKARYVLGWGRERLTQQFVFAVGSDANNLFARLMREQQAMWVDPADAGPLTPLITPRIRELSADAGFFVTPIVVNHQSIGLFYADRQPSGRALEADSFESFKHFGQQANLSLAFLSQRR